jgi:hypothetical protein
MFLILNSVQIEAYKKLGIITEVDGKLIPMGFKVIKATDLKYNHPQNQE